MWFTHPDSDVSDVRQIKQLIRNFLSNGLNQFKLIIFKNFFGYAVNLAVIDGLTQVILPGNLVETAINFNIHLEFLAQFTLANSRSAS